MKYIIIVVAVIAVLTVLYLLVFTDTIVGRKEEIPELAEDGYVKDTSDKSASKKVESCEITDFSLFFHRNMG